MVKITGDMTISFPATIVPLLLKQGNPTVLKFEVHGTNSLEQILPNKRLVEKYVDSTTRGCILVIWVFLMIY